MVNNAKVGGILSIVSGAFGVFGSVMIILWIFMFNFLLTMPPTQDPFAPPFPHEFFQFILIIYGAWGLLLALIGALGIVGGSFTLKRKNWPLALAGSIAGTITFFPCGIPAIIFVSVGKEEFS